MKDFWDKAKISSDIFNANKVAILMGLSLFGSGLINLTQMIYGEEKDVLVGSMTDTITILAETYVVPTNKPKTITVKSNCNGCRTMWLGEIKKVNKRIDEWHGR